MPSRYRALLPAYAGGVFVTSQTQILRALRSTVCFADGIFVNGAGPLMPTRCRALLPADAGGAFVNGLRKTNVCSRSRLFFAALIISYSPKLLSVNVFPSVIHHSTGKICHLISHTPQITTDDHALSASFTIEYGHFPIIYLIHMIPELIIGNIFTSALTLKMQRTLMTRSPSVSSNRDYGK